MAAGPGRRMGRITSFGTDMHSGNTPKPALPVVNRPNISRIIDQMVGRGVTDFWVTSHHMAGDIIRIVGHGERYGAGIRIRHVVEDALVHTALATKQIADNFDEDEPFWVLSGDIFSPLTNFGAFFTNFQNAQKANPHIAGCVGFALRPARQIINRYTTAIINRDNLVEEFREPPTSEAEALSIFHEIQNETISRVSDQLGQPVLPINGSTYLMTRRIFHLVAEPDMNPSVLYDFGRYIFPNAPARSISAYFIPENVSGDRLEESWTDIGFPEDLWRANFRLIRYAPYLIRGKYAPEKRSWIGSGCKIRGQVEDSVIGNNVFIGPGIHVKGSIIGPGSTLEGLRLLKGSVVLPYTYVNTRRYARRVEEITDSLLISRSTGGTFIDQHSTGTRKIEGRLAVPDIDGQIKLDDLILSADDLKILA